MMSNLRYHFLDSLKRNDHKKAIVVLCKSLYLFIVAKILFLWTVLPDIITYLPLKLISLRSQIAYFPIHLAQTHLNLFLISFLILLVVAVIIRLNYFIAALICWLSFCLSRLTGPLANGSDQVLNLFLALAIFLSPRPTFRSGLIQSVQVIISGFAFLLCRIQFTLIYLLSGFDKLTSEAWRSGDAVYSITNLEFYFNPRVPVHFTESIYASLGWAVIVFELCFPILIWFRRIRLWILIAGLIFHLSIIFFLSLPDFGLIMILTYSLFLPEEAIEWIVTRRKKMPEHKECEGGTNDTTRS